VAAIVAANKGEIGFIQVKKAGELAGIRIASIGPIGGVQY
jgi:hypothetical protein